MGGQHQAPAAFSPGNTWYPPYRRLETKSTEYKIICVSFAVEIEGVQLPGSAGSDVSVITQAQEGQHFVSIDGKRTYINLFGSSTEQGGIAPTRIQQGGHTLPPHKSASAIGTG